eukprot:gnl/TRDRNA2_/TRDRNA2_177616_c3_seq6.p1 gnl/TRDRNA2_/TRDRNA2_177616_c3~~gnl/TRDRNA2_/TRDRNA2_177616_c3_seq6.p1  ORF type:complete len:241 (+),score=36.72 gnl/TRDRNA2_/TRDRNA2_177616_c3_seq6:59-781(+)
MSGRPLAVSPEGITPLEVFREDSSMSMTSTMKLLGVSDGDPPMSRIHHTCKPRVPTDDTLKGFDSSDASSVASSYTQSATHADFSRQDLPQHCGIKEQYELESGEAVPKVIWTTPMPLVTSASSIATDVATASSGAAHLEWLGCAERRAFAQRSEFMIDAASELDLLRKQVIADGALLEKEEQALFNSRSSTSWDVQCLQEGRRDEMSADSVDDVSMSVLTGEGPIVRLPRILERIRASM